MKCTKIISVFSQGSASDPAAEATMLLWTSQSVGEGIPCPHSPPTQSMPGPVFKYDHLALLHTKKTISYRKQCLTAQTRNSRAGCFRSFARGSCLRDTSATAALHCADWLSRGTSCKAHTTPPGLLLPLEQTLRTSPLAHGLIALPLQLSRLRHSLFHGSSEQITKFGPKAPRQVYAHASFSPTDHKVK